MTPQELIDTKVARCLGTWHLWREAKLFGCETCGAEHDGFTCDACSRVVDAIHDRHLYAAIVQIGLWLPEEPDEDNT
jgi:hypothetical protein